MKTVLNIIFSIIIFSGTAFAVYKTFAYDAPETVFERSKKLNGVRVAGYAFLFRIAVYVISMVFTYFIDGQLTFDIFFERWTRWDATNYIRIAQSWYTGYTENGDFLTLVFFPMYPIVGHIVNFIIPDIRLALMLTSSIAYSVGCGYMYELIRYDCGTRAALNSVISISLFPFAFFFGAIMTESVFFMTCAMTFYYTRKHKWLAAGICGALSSFSRLIGAFIIVPMVVEWIDYYKPFTKKRPNFCRLLIKASPAALTIVGTAAYLVINYCVSGSPFQFMEYQNKYWYHSSCYFAGTIADIFGYALSFNTDSVTRISIWIPETIIFTAAAISVLYSSYKLRNMYTVYLAGYIIINCSVTWLISGARYMSAAIPMFMVFGCVMHKNKLVSCAVYGVSFLLMLFYMYRYLSNMQVM